jgi:hypothetical protein
VLGQHFFKVHAGDFGEGEGHLGTMSCVFSLPVPGKMLAEESIRADRVHAVEIATEERVKKLGGTVGWGLLGGALLGPAGLLAGLLAGGRDKRIVFTMQFSDGRKLLASADGSAFTAIQAATFQRMCAP